MLFTGFIAALIARFYDHQANRARRLPSAQQPSSQERDEDEPGTGKPGPYPRNC